MECNAENGLTGQREKEDILLSAIDSSQNAGDTSHYFSPCPAFPSKSYNHPEFCPDLEKKVIELKHSCEKWRDIILPINSILNWEKQWHPFCIAGCTTAFFMMLWLLNPSILTTVSLMGLCLSVCDYLVPHVSATLLKSEPWTEKEEEKLDRICRSIVLRKENLSLTYRSIILMKENRPKLFYGISIVGLLFLAWIGNVINNLFLTYLVITFVCLVPGMEKNGILEKYGCIIGDKIAELAAGAKINIAAEKKSN